MSGIEIKWFPRSWLQIITNGIIIYIDPSYISSYYKKHASKVVFSDVEDDCLPEELEKGNLILLSHIHKDHCKEATLNRLLNKDTVVFTPKKFKRDPDNRIKFIHPGYTYSYMSISIEVINAYNTEEGNSIKKVHRKGDCVGYILNFEGKRIYFSGDTDIIPEMRNLGDIDIAIVPIGGVFTMDMGEAIDCILSINPKSVIPVHHLKTDPWEFKKKLNKQSDINVILLGIGEKIEY